MRRARRAVSLIAASFALVAALAPPALGADGSECVEYNGRVVYCIHY